MRMYIKSVVVDDQEKALSFYTEKLGFDVKHDIPMGEFRWLTLVSKEDPDGVELALEPNAHPASRTFQKAMYGDGIPFTAFRVDDIESEVERLQSLGVAFRQLPTSAGEVTIATLDDTCGNLIQLVQFNS